MTDSAENGEVAWHRRTASQCNNAAWELIEKPTLTPGELGELLLAASTATHHWRAVGTPANVAHADLLFAWAVARSGSGATAVEAAGRALRYFEDNDSQNWECAFAHAAMAVASDCISDGDRHRQHYSEAERFAATLEERDREYFDAAFRTVPAPQEQTG